MSRSRDLSRGREAFEAGDYATAERLLAPLAETGEAQALDLLVEMSRWGHIAEDANTVALHERAAAGGNAWAALRLGMAHSPECKSPPPWDAVAKDKGKSEAYFGLAVSLYREQSAAGDVEATGMLACCYQLGFGVERNLDEAIRLHTEYFRRGGRGSANNLAAIYYEDLEPSPANLRRARYWYRKTKQHNCRRVGLPLDE